MKIIKSYDFHRRDFWADMECQYCGYVEKEIRCYDDTFFHQQVIPNMVCKNCGKKGEEITTGARFDDNVVM